jgi:signal transduction histidine kinase
MIKKLRIKLILVITGALILIFGTVFLTLNLSVYSASERESERFMQMIADNDGLFLPGGGGFLGNPDNQLRYPGINPESISARRFFYVKINTNNTVLESNYDMMFDFSENDATEYINEALASNNNTGTIGSFSYLIEDKHYGRIAVFAERSVEMGMLSRLTETSLIVAGISCVLLLGLSFLLSKWMVKPVESAFNKQRRFISDANHELKTPLTIISANVDVMQNEIGYNPRFEPIRTQLARMNKLIHNLLILSKTEEADFYIVHRQFDLSKTVLNTVLELESLAFEEGKDYEYEIIDGISFTGDEDKFKQLLTILIDNAIKHSDADAKIRIILKEKSGKPHLSVYNSGTGIPDAERGKIFDRFYRCDDSRTRETGGYGLGLSVAKAVVDAHKGKIRVIGEYGKWVEFIVVL